MSIAELNAAFEAADAAYKAATAKRYSVPRRGFAASPELRAAIDEQIACREALEAAVRALSDALTEAGVSYREVVREDLIPVWART